MNVGSCRVAGGLLALVGWKEVLLVKRVGVTEERQEEEKKRAGLTEWE